MIKWFFSILMILIAVFTIGPAITLGIVALAFLFLLFNQRSNEVATPTNRKEIVETQSNKYLMPPSTLKDRKAVITAGAHKVILRNKGNKMAIVKDGNIRIELPAGQEAVYHAETYSDNRKPLLPEILVSSFRTIIEVEETRIISRTI